MRFIILKYIFVIFIMENNKFSHNTEKKREKLNNALKENKNIVIVGDYDNKYPFDVTNTVHYNLYGLQEVNINSILKEEKPFILNTKNKGDMKRLDSFDILYELIEINETD